MPRINELLSRPGSDWKSFKQPAPEDEIAEACELIGRTLPKGLIELYHECNGGEGSLPFQPWNFVLWGIEYVVQVREDEYYRKYYNPFVFFGTSGGGEYFGLDPSGRVFIMDPVAGEESNIVIAQSFDDFVQQIGVLPPEGLAVVDGAKTAGKAGRCQAQCQTPIDSYSIPNLSKWATRNGFCHLLRDCKRVHVGCHRELMIA